MRILQVLTWGTLVCSFLPFFTLTFSGAAALVAELSAHFRVQYLALSLLLLAGWLLYRQWRYSVLALICLCLNGSYLKDAYLKDAYVTDAQAATPTAVPGQAEGAARPVTRILFANVLQSNQAYAAILQLVRETAPDLIVLQEVDSVWLSALAPLRANFPYISAVPRSDYFGFAVLARDPLQADITYPASELPIVHLQLLRGDARLHLVSTHAIPPLGVPNFRRRNLQLEEVADLLTHLRGPKAFLGDLNLTPWSPYFTRLKARTQLRDARAGLGILPSWPVWIDALGEDATWTVRFSQALQTPLFMLPIDHCLVSQEVRVLKFGTGPDIGSDHLPLILELAW